MHIIKALYARHTSIARSAKPARKNCVPSRLSWASRMICEEVCCAIFLSRLPGEPYPENQGLCIPTRRINWKCKFPIEKEVNIFLKLSSKYNSNKRRKSFWNKKLQNFQTVSVNSKIQEVVCCNDNKKKKAPDFRFFVGSTAWGRIYLARLVWTLCKLPLSKDAGKSADLLLFFGLM